MKGVIKAKGLEREIKILNTLSHPSIIRFIEVIKTKLYVSYFIKVCLVMEIFGKYNIRSYIENQLKRKIKISR